MDRLEVEMVYLLFLYGAKISNRSITKNSLGSSEWVGYDLFLNLDTGRWLHRHSEEAIMDHGNQILQPTLCNRLLDWSSQEAMTILKNEELSQLSKLPRLFALVLADGCDAITSNEAFATLIRHLKIRYDTNNPISTPLTGGNGSIELPGNFPQPNICDDLYDLLEKHGCDVSDFRVAGRTIFFSCRNPEGEIAVKMSKEAEIQKVPHPLSKEAAMNTLMKGIKEEYCLLSDFPETLDLIRVPNVPPSLREAIVSQESVGYHPFSLANDADNDDADGVIMLVYRPPIGYGVYINDPSISLDTCTVGIQKAAFDAAVLARHGLYHAALVDIQHDSSREERPHLWSFESFLTRFRGGA